MTFFHDRHQITFGDQFLEQPLDNLPRLFLEEMDAKKCFLRGDLKEETCIIQIYKRK